MEHCFCRHLRPISPHHRLQNQIHSQSLDLKTFKQIRRPVILILSRTSKLMSCQQTKNKTNPNCQTQMKNSKIQTWIKQRLNEQLELKLLRLKRKQDAKGKRLSVKTSKDSSNQQNVRRRNRDCVNKSKEESQSKIKRSENNKKEREEKWKSK